MVPGERPMPSSHVFYGPCVLPDLLEGCKGTWSRSPTAMSFGFWNGSFGAAQMRESSDPLPSTVRMRTHAGGTTNCCLKSVAPMGLTVEVAAGPLALTKDLPHPGLGHPGGSGHGCVFRSTPQTYHLGPSHTSQPRQNREGSGRAHCWGHSSCLQVLERHLG